MGKRKLSEIRALRKEAFTSCDYTTIEQKRQLIMTFINAIYLFDDKIIIAYNYMERQETVLLSDLKETSLVPVSSLNNYGAPEKAGQQTCFFDAQNLKRTCHRGSFCFCIAT